MQRIVITRSECDMAEHEPCTLMFQVELPIPAEQPYLIVFSIDREHVTVAAVSSFSHEYRVTIGSVGVNAERNRSAFPCRIPRCRRVDDFSYCLRVNCEY